MVKVLKKKLIITLVIAATVVGISTQTLFMLNKAHTQKTQAANIKEKSADNIESDSSKTEENNKNTDVLANAEKQHDNNDMDEQETTNLQIENTNNNHDTDIQKAYNSQAEKTNNNNTNKQEAVGSQQEKTDNNNKQPNTNTQAEIEEKDINNTSETKTQSINYDRTTTIYANDNITLLRVEYYLNNKLTYYSVVEQFDATTKSYVEKIYKCNRETNIDPLIRTDVYINGSLIKSY